jgi:uncharacterized membrane protein YkoI
MTVGLIWLGLTAVACSSNPQKEDQEEHEQKVELQITADQLPPPVKDTMQKEADGADLTQLEKETKGDKTHYEAHAAIDGKDYEIKVAEDGTLLKKSLETGEKHEEHEHQDKD